MAGNSKIIKLYCRNVSVLHTICFHMGSDAFTSNTQTNKPVMNNCIVWCRYYMVICSDVVKINAPFNTLRPKQYGRHIADNIFKCTFFNENMWHSLKFHWALFLSVQLTVSKHRLGSRQGDKSLSEPLVVRFPLHICVTRFQCVYIWFMLSLNAKCYALPRYRL